MSLGGTSFLTYFTVWALLEVFCLPLTILAALLLLYVKMESIQRNWNLKFQQRALRDQTTAPRGKNFFQTFLLSSVWTWNLIRFLSFFAANKSKNQQTRKINEKKRCFLNFFFSLLFNRSPNPPRWPIIKCLRINRLFVRTFERARVIFGIDKHSTRFIAPMCRLCVRPRKTERLISAFNNFSPHHNYVLCAQILCIILKQHWRERGEKFDSEIKWKNNWLCPCSSLKIISSFAALFAFLCSTRCSLINFFSLLSR